ncbi:hypothetical protein BO71DRAFT_483251 [Aspergillus ellipticus CBS 707.79]|uniref:Uncharacterized protein n=1 Tax=Aspergillus ellipticus CBS 707.79 TaxID=1448320 RepID=A0A319DD10_9EURO|nr:hypothetical protein BO71DRAFT_483251 [Aspergillus ellipticus CBS 707.79]
MWSFLRTCQGELSPRREYYPAHLKCQQVVKWNRDITTTIQDDEFRPKVESILTKPKGSRKVFRPGLRTSKPPILIEDVPHPRERALARRRAYAREVIGLKQRSTPVDNKYTRSKVRGPEREQRVSEIIPTSCYATVQR